MQRRDRLVVLAAAVPQSANPSSGFVIGPYGRCLVGSLAWRCHGHQRTRSAANREVQSSGARIRSAVSGGQPRPTSWATLAVSMSRLSAACCASASGRPSRRSTRKRHAVTLGSGFGRGDQVGALIDGLVARSSAVLPCLGMAGDCGFSGGINDEQRGQAGVCSPCQRPSAARAHRGGGAGGRSGTSSGAGTGSKGGRDGKARRR